MLSWLLGLFSKFIVLVMEFFLLHGQTVGLDNGAQCNMTKRFNDTIIGSKELQFGAA